MQFDVRAAKALRVGEHLIIPGAPGLRLEANAKGRTFVYRYKSPADALMKQIKIGAWPETSAVQAGAEWERLRKERDAGRCPATLKRRARQQEAARPALADVVEVATVGALLDVYEQWATANRVQKGAYELRRMLKRHASPRFRALAPHEVTRAVAYDTIYALRDTPVEAGNLRRELGAAWEFGHDSGRLAETVPNWWRQVLRGKLKSKGRKIRGENVGTTKRALSLDEGAALIRFLPHYTLLIRDLLTLYLWTGCRGTELVQMEGAELSQDAAGVLWWLLPKEKVKMAAHELAADLWIPLLGRAREIALRRQQEWGAAYLFPSSKSHRSTCPHVQQKVVGVAVWTHHPDCRSRPESERERLAIAHWAPHDLRRTVRTHLSRLKCPRDIAEAVLGHIDTEEDVYDRHDYRVERLEWLTRLTESWEQAARR